MNTRDFTLRHIGPNAEEINQMLLDLKQNSVDELIDKIIPSNIKLSGDLNIEKKKSEVEYLSHMEDFGRKNKVYKTYIGLGYHPTILPSVIKRNIFENPSWYTAYTPYQPEISQGRLEALINFQTLITELTSMEIANASLLDESTAAAEAMGMFFALRSRAQKKAEVSKFFVSENLFPQTISVLKNRAEPLGIELVIGNEFETELDNTFFGAAIQYPAKFGNIYDYSQWVEKAKSLDIKTVFSADLLSLTLLTPPGEWGADAVVGSSQRFGIPMGYGGPHAAFFATKEEYKRSIPGRIIGQTKDASGKKAYRMALQTREQHIKREKATSNICTSQVLLAVMAGMYSVYHGPNGLKFIAQNINQLTSQLSEAINSLGLKQLNSSFFDTIHIDISGINSQKGNLIESLKLLFEDEKINIFYINEKEVSISLNETTRQKDIDVIISIFEKFTGKEFSKNTEINPSISESSLKRKTDFLQQKVFNSYHSETKLMRYIKSLETKDLSLTYSMIPLGSCTMKLNAASEMIPIGWSNWGNLHPFAPTYQTRGYQEIFKRLEKDLAEITGLYATSLQPNSGAQGEYSGLMVIRAYHIDNNNQNRNIILIPASAHGTNPASAVMAGMKVVVIKTDEEGSIDVADLKEKAELHKDNLAGLMITYPSTHGVYESAILEVVETIHQKGGLVYMDGANMNAQVGLTSPGKIGVDVCHLNLHKTFAIPHGGGGPGMGPICVTKDLAKFLPSNPIIPTGGNNPIESISAAPWGSALILLISYGYIQMLGKSGLKQSSEIAILNANYLMTKLKDEYDVLYTGENGFVAHELIIDCRPFKKVNIEVVDIAKRLMDYGFHAPTVSFPVGGTIMIEPTESESKEELDRFVEAMLSIKKEIDKIAESEDLENNVLKNAPHTLNLIASDNWDFDYTRQEAAFPTEFVVNNKLWPTVQRVDEAYGDRNLICTCEPLENYA